MAFLKALKTWKCVQAWGLESVKGPITWLYC